MKRTTHRTTRVLSVTLGASLLGLAAASSWAANGSWAVDADGNWSDATKWLGNILASGAGSTAFFTNELTAARTVTLDSAQTIGNLLFADADPVGTPGGGWVLAGSLLTLTNSGGTPVITVRDLANTDGLSDAKITAAVSSEQGFVKRGTNTLYLTAANTFNAPVRLEEGLVAVGNLAALGASNREVVFDGGGVGVVSGINYGNTNNVISTGWLRNLSGANYDGLKGPWVGSTSAVMNVYSGNRFTMDVGNASLLSNFKGTICLSNSPSGCLLRINMGAGPYDMSAITLDTGSGAGRFASRITSAATGVWKIGALKGAGGQLCGSENSGGTLVVDEVGYLNTDTTFGGVIRPYGSGREVALTKVGTGKLTLTGTSTYAGNTVISNGVLALSGSGAISTSPLFNIMAGGRFDVSGLDAGTWSTTAAQTLAGAGAVIGNLAVLQGTIAPGVSGFGTLSFSNNLSLAGTSTTTNLFKVGAAANDRISVAGDLTVSDLVIIRVVPTGVVIPNGTYTLVKCGGTLVADLANLTLEYPAQTGTLTLGINRSAKEIYLTVSGVSSAANLTWMGDLTPDWDTATANWRQAGVSSFFATGDNVTFDNTSSVTNVNLPADVAPGSVVVNASKDYRFDTASGTAKITGMSSLLKTNTGMLTLVTDNDYVGGTTILKGHVVIGDGVNPRGKLGTGAITNQGTVTYNRPDDLTVTDVFYGTGNLVKVSPNTLTMNGINNCAGGITISNGTVAITSYAALSSNTVVMAGGQLTIYPAGGGESGLAGRLNVVDHSTISYAASGTYACVFTGPLTGVSGKMLTLTPTSSSTSRVRVYSSFTNNADLNLNGSTMFLAPYHSSGIQMYNGVVSGSGAIVVRCGGGQAILNNAANTYSGGTLLSLGTIGVGADSVESGGALVSGPLGTGPIVSTIESSTVGSCTLFASGGPRTVANPITYDSGVNFTTIVLSGSNNLTLSGPMSLNGNDGNITNRPIDVNNTALSTLSGVISDGGQAGVLTKAGNGILVLSGTNTYTGPTYVAGGTLLVNGQIDIGGVVATNGNLGGIGVILGPVTVGADANLMPGNSGIGTLTIHQSLTLAGDLMVEVNKSQAQSNDLVVVSGALSSSGAGMVVVTNLGSTALAVGDRFQLFNKAITGGAALAVTGAGATWSNRLALDGSIVVQALNPIIPTTPTNVVYSVSGGKLTLSWPASYAGWDLQSNSVGVAYSTMWFTVPGSAATNQVILPLDATWTNVFYRLHYLAP